MWSLTSGSPCLTGLYSGTMRSMTPPTADGLAIWIGWVPAGAITPSPSISVGSRPKIPQATQTTRRTDAITRMIHELEFTTTNRWSSCSVELSWSTASVRAILDRFRWLISLRSS